MLYRLVRPIARYVLARYYRNVDITGLEHIPRNAPVILAANHPTAFIDPCLLACFQSRPLYFLARGDFFRNKLAAWTLRALNILPVYRLQDGGYGALTRNYETFEECFAALHRGKALMVLAEGRCVHEKRLRSLRKGTARVALGTMNQYPELPEVYIVPVGFNYTAADRARSSVLIRCGQALRTSDFLATYHENEANGLREFTDSLHDALAQLVVHLPDGGDDTLYETVLTVRDNELAADITGITHSGRRLDKQLTTIRNALADKPGTLRYAAQLEVTRLRDRDVRDARQARRLRLAIVPAVLLQLPLLPLYLLAEGVAITQARKVEFHSPLRFATLAVGLLLYVPVLAVVPVWAKAWLALSLVAASWSLREVERWRDWYGKRRYDLLPAATRERMRELRRALLG